MYAIVLTYDNRKPFVDLVLQSYQSLYPNNPFTFRIPYNNHVPSYTGNIELIQTKRNIRDTIAGLIDGIPDNEFVYWCFDDIYPVKLYDTTCIDILAKTLKRNDCENVDAVRLINVPADKKNGVNQNYKFTINRFSFYLRIPYRLYSFWSHNFIRVGLLRKLFLNNILPYNYTLNKVPRASHCPHRIWVPTENIGIFGETTRKSRITINCMHDMKKYGIKIPNVARANRIIYNNGSVKDF